MELAPLVRLLSSNIPTWKTILLSHEKRMFLSIMPACIVFAVEVIQSIARAVTGLPVQLFIFLYYYYYYYYYY